MTVAPFSRTLPFFPIEGRDLNPQLQDPGLIIWRTLAMIINEALDALQKGVARMRLFHHRRSTDIT
jgi:hypothetical protein